jgi:Cof subfamily protein (haloacid dehalogenase superfamily)
MVDQLVAIPGTGAASDAGSADNPALPALHQAVANQRPARMIAFDIDGTLMPTSGPMADRTRCALQATVAAGIEVVIATGRRQAYAAPLLAPIGLAPQTILISSNGTVTREFGGRTLDRSYLPVEIARDLCAVLRPFGGTTVYTFDRIGRGELVIESLERLHERIAPWVNANLPWIEEIDPLERAFDKNEAPIQGMVCGTVEEMTRAEQHLVSTRYASLIEMHRTEYASRDLSILDLLPRGCSKGVALSKLAAKRGIPRAEVMAIGDNWNDLEMLRWAGQPVLMGNASPQLQAIAAAEGWEITATNDECGVALVLERLLGTAALANGSAQANNSQAVVPDAFGDHPGNKPAVAPESQSEAGTDAVLQRA